MKKVKKHIFDKFIPYYKITLLSFAIGLMLLSCTVKNKVSNEKNKQSETSWVYPLSNGNSSIQGEIEDWRINESQLELMKKNPPGDRENLWFKNEYCDFEIEFEFNLNKNTNSGLFLRTFNINNPVQTGIEVQLRDDFGKENIDNHFCGSIYGCSQPNLNVVKEPGQWNKISVLCKGKIIRIILNNKEVNNINLNNWTEIGENPDGTKNKFKTAYANMSLCGYIGFQDHGGIIKIRKLRIRTL